MTLTEHMWWALSKWSKQRCWQQRQPGWRSGASRAQVAELAASASAQPAPGVASWSSAIALWHRVWPLIYGLGNSSLGSMDVLPPYLGLGKWLRIPLRLLCWPQHGQLPLWTAGLGLALIFFPQHGGPQSGAGECEAKQKYREEKERSDATRSPDSAILSCFSLPWTHQSPFT